MLTHKEKKKYRRDAGNGCSGGGCNDGDDKRVAVISQPLAGRFCFLLSLSADPKSPIKHIGRGVSDLLPVSFACPVDGDMAYVQRTHGDDSLSE